MSTLAILNSARRALAARRQGNTSLLTSPTGPTPPVFASPTPKTPGAKAATPEKKDEEGKGTPEPQKGKRVGWVDRESDDEAFLSPSSQQKVIL